ncbi:MAG: thioredoxin [Desulfovibrio sp.]|nr:thioredoxin [Desulfovibrio sp.]
MEYIFVGLLLAFLLFLFLDAKRRAANLQRHINEERKAIAEASNMTASIGVFYPDGQSTVIMGASEEMGALYYRMLRGDRLINRTKINLANIIRVELLLNSMPHPFESESSQPTSTLKSTDIANQVLASISQEALQGIQKAALRILFFSETGTEKSLEITSFRVGDERYRFKRTQMIKNSIWWVAFLNLASRHVRHASHQLQSLAEDQPLAAPPPPPAG